jgi:ribonuclease HI
MVAASGTQAQGGYAALIMVGDKEQIISGREPATTNNKMEMTAAIKALEALPAGLPAVIHSDSQYVVKGITEWLPGWKKRGWKTGDKKPVLNQPLWLRLEELAGERRVQWVWVRGHAGHEQNERVDAIANAEAMRAAREAIR